MIVYGDHAERVDPRSRLDQLAAAREGVHGLPPGLDRHTALVELFVDMAGLVQGIADAEFDPDGGDRRSPAQDASMAILMALAEAVRTSWDSGFARMSDLPEFKVAVPLPSTVDIRLAEGHAFYALYPEAYVEAARRLGCRGPVLVIGIRSIGAGLAAIVAATLASPAPVTVRPIGHPFDRRVNLAPDLARELLSDRNATYVIVDEGPGLSGSSFGAVADFLEDHGVPADRIAFLSGHGGDLGPRASQRHRARWATARRKSADPDRLLSAHLERWAADRLGPLDAPLETVSGGAWRRHNRDDAQWPAVNPLWERHKVIARAGGGTWLLKFAGLGATGRLKLARARALHAAGFGAEPRALVHGFLVERWMADARPIDAEHDDRQALLRFVAAYLGFRAGMLAPSRATSASLGSLLEMARFNIAEVLGGERAAKLDRWRERLVDLEAVVVPIEIDGRCLAHEWLRLPGGRLLKTDALDHHAAHDLVGCQDLAWDVVGAAVELDLPVGELAMAVSAAAGRPIDAELMAFLTPCYLAFRLGSHRLAATMLRSWTAEKARNEAAADRYAALIEQLLADAPPNQIRANQEALCE